MTTSAPLVSIILPIHNAASYLVRTYRLLQAMDRSVSYEFVIVDDNSTDESYEIASSWSDLPGSKILMRAEKRGVANARNQALRTCTGEFVWMCDADDEWTSTVVSDMVNQAIETRATVVLCNAVKRTEQGHLVGRILDAADHDLIDGAEAFVRLLEGSIQGHLWNKLFRRSALGLDPFPEVRAHSDLGGMLAILPAATRVAHLPLELYSYLQNSGSILNSRTYDYTNLLTCLKIAQNGAKLGTIRADSALVRFTYGTVVVPTMNEVARRLGEVSPLVLNEVVSQIRSVTSARSLRRYLRLAGGLRPAMQAVLVVLAPRAYVRLYAAISGVTQR